MLNKKIKNPNKIKHVIDGVVKKDMCIGCGICANVCPHNCLDIKLDKNKEYAPVFNKNKCTNCSICLQYCPHSEMNIIKQLDEVKSNPKYYGTENANYYVAWDNNDNNRIKSASGGIVTQIAKYMLANNYVSGIIHGEMVENDRKGIHYRAAISRTLEEIDERRSSFYFAFTFDNILKEIKDSEEAYLFIGVPCIIRGVKNLFEKNKSYKKIKLYTICLSCSHNVSGLFTDYLADSLNINKRQKYTVNLRDKDKNMVDANNYMNTYKRYKFFHLPKPIQNDIYRHLAKPLFCNEYMQLLFGFLGSAWKCKRKRCLGKMGKRRQIKQIDSNIKK